MHTVVKNLSITDATLVSFSAGQRNTVAEFNGTIEINETDGYSLPVLGRPIREMKKIYASFILAEPTYCSMEISSGMVFEAIGDVEGEKEKRRLIFSGLTFKDNDPYNGTITFEVPDIKLIELMLRM